MPIYKIDGKKKNGQQAYRVRVSVKENGKFKQIERTAYGFEAAKACEIRLLVGKREIHSLTVKQLCAEFLTVKRGQIKESTLDKYEQSFRRDILPYLENKNIAKITPKTLVDWRLQIDRRNVTATTKNHAYASLNAILNYAVKMEYISRNPMKSIDRFKDYAASKEMQFYTVEEFQKYAATAREICEQKNEVRFWGYYIFFLIAFFVGTRKGETNALRWTDQSGNVFRIRRSINQKLKGVDRETVPKTKKSIRDVSIPVPLEEELQVHKARQLAAGLPNDCRICGGLEPLRDTSVEEFNRKVAQAAGLKHIRIHDFRHSHASALINAGINIIEISRRLGHSNVQETWNTYSHLYPDELSRANEILSEISLKNP